MHGLFLEGARTENRCLERSFPKVLVEPLPILSIQPIEAHRLKLQVCCVPFSMITIQYIVMCSINASTHSITCLKWPPSISLTFTFPLHLISYDFMCVYFMKSIEQKCLADSCATPTFLSLSLSIFPPSDSNHIQIVVAFPLVRFIFLFALSKRKITWIVLLKFQL